MQKKEPAKDFFNIPASAASSDSAEPALSAASALNELMRAEKSVAEESLRLSRRRFERERARWQKIIELKQREILELRHRIENAESSARSVEKKLDEERELSMDRVRSQAAELEAQRMNQSRKWAVVEEELKKYRAEAHAMRPRLETALREISELKRRNAVIQRTLGDEIRAKEDSALALEQKMREAEQSHLKEKHALKEEMSSMGDALNRARAELSDEKLHREKLAAKRDEEIKTLKESLLEKIKVITELESARIESDRLRIRAEERLSAVELEINSLKASVDDDRRRSTVQIEDIRAAAAAEAETKLSEFRARLQEKSVAENELKHRLYTLELERNSEVNRHNSEIASKEREIKKLEAILERNRPADFVAAGSGKVSDKKSAK